jgi:F-type H+-transporting ATPase subunit a
MNVDVTGAYIYFTIPIFGGIPITQTAVSGLIVTLILCSCFIILGKDLKKRPDGRQVLVEEGVKMLYNLVCDTMGKHNAHYLPLIGTIFLSSILSSYIGLTGFFRSATADLSVPLVWAVAVSVIIWTNTIKRDGLGSFLKNYINPMNIVSDVAQPASMALRHFGNVAGGGVITTILYTALSMVSAMVLDAIASNGVAIAIVLLVVGAGLIFLWSKKKKAVMLVFGIVMAVLGFFGGLQALGILSGVPIFAFGIPAVLSLYFDLFSGFVQALVFTLLSMVYIAGSCPEPEAAQSESV